MRLKGATLIETMVGMVILITVLAVATSVFINLFGSETAQRQKLRYKTREVFYRALEDPVSEHANISLDGGYEIEKKYLPSLDPKLKLLSVTLRKKEDKVLFSCRQWIIIK